ncbi:TIGR00730 family Rossman fold protein [Alteribacter lacisalsi]|uniref:Cytokinin riboside 5'-monophosphate phosphoribohydrolase n=1 Tax=Alteribacter lacisalsi TaxID=2045244 RepID=A0A2W0HN94_9BACI|nr:TIGR00730 family Rossman fold protein [Alteribacter lacisalsi]PYZ99045.1 TIGR00730 family Rossman fold protein [Alteribacter lacisalsi]
MKRCAVFCGSRAGRHPEYTNSARVLGKALAERNIELVYGGASVGIMAAVADGVLENGGRVIGILPEFLGSREIAHQKLTELHIVKTMRERKQMISDLSDGFIAMPGGIGTMEEYFEMLTQEVLGQHKGKNGLLNINGYYSPLVSFFDHMKEQGFLDDEVRRKIVVEEDPVLMIERLME